MLRLFKFSVLILGACFCLSCSTVKEPTLRAYHKTLVLLHIENPADSQPDSQPQVCLLDPTSLIGEQPAQPAGNSTAAPSAEVGETTHDFGAVREDGDYVHHFRVKNVGKAELSIKKIVPG